MKALKTVVLILIIIPILYIGADAADNESDFSDEISAYGADEIYESLDDEAKEALSSLGIDKIDFSSVNDVSPADIFNLIKDLLSGGYKETFKNGAEIIGIILICALVQIFADDSKKANGAICTAGILACAAALCVPVINAVKSSVASVCVCCTFVKSLIPVMAGIVIASGSPAGAASFQVSAFAAAQFISSSAAGFAVPVLSAAASVDLAGSLLPEYNLDKISSFIKKTMISVISGISALYAAFLSIKDVLNDAVDSLSVKGVKLLINSAVPVIGAPLSELYGSLTGTASLIKSTVGVFAIISICVITLPPLLNLLIWIFTLKALGCVSGVLLQDGLSKFFSSLAGVLTLMNVIMLLNCAIFIISVALILNRGG